MRLLEKNTTLPLLLSLWRSVANISVPGGVTQLGGFREGNECEGPVFWGGGKRPVLGTYRLSDFNTHSSPSPALFLATFRVSQLLKNLRWPHCLRTKAATPYPGIQGPLNVPLPYLSGLYSKLFHSMPFELRTSVGDGTFSEFFPAMAHGHTLLPQAKILSEHSV